MNRIERARIGLGFSPNEPFSHRMVKRIKEDRARQERKRKARERHAWQRWSFATAKDVKNRFHFQLNRAMEHVSGGTATDVEINYCSKHKMFLPILKPEQKKA